MRRYTQGQEAILQQVRCNACGKEMQVRKGMLVEECFHAKNVFGYFSEKDGVCEEFDLCEKCYQEMVRHFQIEVTRTEVTELL